LAGPKQINLAILTDLGTDHRCFKVATALRSQGYDPVIYCDRPSTPPGKAWDGFRVESLTERSHFHGFARAFFPFLLRLAPKVLFAPGRTWLVLDCPPLFWVALLGRLRGRQVIYDSHEIFLETPLVLGRPSRRLFWRLWHDGGLALVSKMIAVSPLCADFFRARYRGQRIFLLPNAPLASPAPQGPKPSFDGGVRLIFQGGLRVATGLEETMLAVASDPRYTLDVYGSGPEAARLREAALPLGKRACYHGSVPFQELRPLMEAAHIGINLMQPICKSFALTLANKLFDYVHALTPVLLSDNPAHRDFLKEHPVGVAVDSFSPEAVKAGLEKLLAGYEGYRGACLKAREEWNWDRFAKGLGAFVES
jgi:glycosyltransferase involved in cell wall biosynthesis